MNLLILSNPTKEQSCSFANKLSRELQNEGVTVFFSPEQCISAPDLIVIAGGDGTVLRHVGTICDFAAPVLGINFGHRGYLTACEPENAKQKILEILSGKCSFECRSLYRCEIFDKNGDLKEEFTGLNEAVLHRGALSKAINFNLYINDNHIISFPADGVIVSTPTGSTAYNFSAQGPILMPDSDSLVITPICASTLLRTSIVTGRNDKIELKLSGDRNSSSSERPVLVADSLKKFTVDFDDRVVVTHSGKFLKIYGGEKGDFLRVLQQKMM